MLTFILNNIIKNKAIKELAPLSLLINIIIWKGDNNMTKKSIPQREKICKVENCTNPQKAKGYCNKHYMQVWYYGKVRKRTVHDPNEIIIKGDTAEIILYNNKCQKIGKAIIDAEDVGKVKKYKWHLHRKNDTHHVATNINQVTVYLSNIIMGRFLGCKKEIDHKNHNLMNNKKSNLRGCTHNQNMYNRKLNKNNTSGYKGVSWAAIEKKWIARIGVKRKYIRVGAFVDKIEAAKAYNTAALQHFGEYACLNEV